MSVLKPIRCEQLSATHLTNSTLEQIAELVWDTDEYIYPAMFCSRGDALRVLPELIRRGDKMFCPENIFIAKAGDDAVGLILWHKGPLGWTPTLFQQVISEFGITQTPYFQKVFREYFQDYNHTASDTTAIINVCVHKTAQGQGIGTRMMQEFLSSPTTVLPAELYVLAENPAAVYLYQKFDFAITETINGFSSDDRALPCYRMRKAH